MVLQVHYGDIFVWECMSVLAFKAQELWLRPTADAASCWGPVSLQLLSCRRGFFSYPLSPFEKISGQAGDSDQCSLFPKQTQACKTVCVTAEHLMAHAVGSAITLITGI